MRKESFICDTCGTRLRLDCTKQHWCKECAGRKETEMRPVRIKKAETAEPAAHSTF